jgi:hypothetical protein
MHWISSWETPEQSPLVANSMENLTCLRGLFLASFWVSPVYSWVDVMFWVGPHIVFVYMVVVKLFLLLVVVVVVFGCSRLWFVSNRKFESHGLGKTFLLKGGEVVEVGFIAWFPSLQYSTFNGE